MRQPQMWWTAGRVLRESIRPGLLATTLVAGTGLAPMCQGQALDAVRHEYSESVMGSEFRVLLYANSKSAADRAAAAAFDRARELESHLSDWMADSELSRLSRSAGSDSCVSVSPDLFRVLHRAQYFARLSDGAFDVTVGPITRQWRHAIRRGELPPEIDVQNALAAVGYRKLAVDTVHTCVQLLAPSMRLDLGGIAKGYAADEMLKTLRSHGLMSVLVDAAGDIVAGEPPPGRSGWRVEIGTVGDGDRVTTEELTLSNAAVASSGDRYRFLEIEDVRYSHIVDPRTGRGITARRLVTVVAPTAMDADALASAISVMGADGLRLADKPGHGARLIEHKKDGVYLRSVSQLESAGPETVAETPKGS